MYAISRSCKDQIYSIPSTQSRYYRIDKFLIILLKEILDSKVKFVLVVPKTNDGIFI